MRFAFGYLKNESEAREVVQELFVHLWENRERLILPEQPKSYLLTAVRNRCINRHKKKSDAPESLQYLDDVVLSDADSSTVLETKELETQLNLLIDALPEKCREIFMLSRFERLSYREIAEMLDISVKTVENQIANALKSLRKNINSIR